MKNNKNTKVIVAMSGGVDSSVSAWLLKNKNYQVEGLFMKNWEEDDLKNYCSAEKDLKDAQLVCDQLGIYLHKINFSSEYWNYVFEIFLKEYKKGNTPNPDILCNKEIKFKLFLNFCIDQLNSDYIATGHYARKRIINKQTILLRGLDLKKDQSYFLYTLKQHQINRILFPIGKFKKSQVRHIAKMNKLHVADKKDSTGICFIGPKNFKKFLSNYFPEKKGDIVTTDNKIIGQHKGLMFYTLGQRKGLGIGGVKGKNNLPWYVVKKDLKLNILVVEQGKLNIFLMSVGSIVKDINWINIDYCLKKNVFCNVQIRYRQIAIPCKLISLNKNLVKVLFKFPISSVTPGQSAVFYFSKNICMGGGVIHKNIPLKN